MPAQPAAPAPAPSVRLLGAMVATMVVAGLVGAAMVVLLEFVQWVAYGVWSHELVPMVQAAPVWRRLLVPTLAGALCGLVWWRVRAAGRLVGAAEATRFGRAMHLPSTLVDAVAQVVLVGAGASLGREGAPREAAAAGADHLAARLRIAPDDRALLVASAAGAGLAAVYVTPLAGAAFALEVVLRRRTWPAALLALPVSIGAVLVARPVVGSGPVLHLPARALVMMPSSDTLRWALLAALVALPVGLGFAWLTRVVGRLRPSPGPVLVLALASAGLAAGLVQLAYPEVAGNGRDLVQLALFGVLGVATAATLVLAKALLTSTHLAAGAAGGLLMPSLAVGAGTGLAVALASGASAPGLTAGALLGAAAVLAVTQRAPLFAGLFAWELTGAHWVLGLACLAVALVADGVHTVVLERLGRPGPSRSRTGSSSVRAAR